MVLTFDFESTIFKFKKSALHSWSDFSTLQVNFILMLRRLPECRSKTQVCWKLCVPV